MRKVTFCPTCGSTNIEWELPHTWSKWRCRECNYVGVFVIEDGEMAAQVRKSYLEEQAKEKKKDEENMEDKEGVNKEGEEEEVYE